VTNDTWRNLLTDALRKRGETLTDLVSCTLTEDELTSEFDSGFGDVNGKPFTAWTAATVYFPLCFDGREWVGSVSRHPDGRPTTHQGGG